MINDVDALLSTYSCRKIQIILFRHVDTLSRMTTPEEYRKNMIKVLDYLNETLPSGSTVIISGLADGRVLWDIMSDR